MYSLDQLRSLFGRLGTRPLGSQMQAYPRMPIIRNDMPYGDLIFPDVGPQTGDGPAPNPPPRYVPSDPRIPYGARPPRVGPPYPDPLYGEDMQPFNPGFPTTPIVSDPRGNPGYEHQTMPRPFRPGYEHQTMPRPYRPAPPIGPIRPPIGPIRYTPPILHSSPPTGPIRYTPPILHSSPPKGPLTSGPFWNTGTTQPTRPSPFPTGPPAPGPRGNTNTTQPRRYSPDGLTSYTDLPGGITQGTSRNPAPKVKKRSKRIAAQGTRSHKIPPQVRGLKSYLDRE